MGNNYAVIPTRELDEGSRLWLADEGIVLPAAVGRWPTTRELRVTLEALDGYTVEYSTTSTGDWDADVRGKGHATIWAKATQSLDAPCDFTFHKPDEVLALRILERLSHVCGPLLIVEASAMHAVVVTPGSDPEELYACWYRHDR